MGLITDPITYNVKVRGRKHLGVERNFDCAALANLINGPAVQERVRKGDMLGYYGHWPRMKFGMDPSEGGIVDGVAVSVPPAIRMIEVSADQEGNVTHRIEFLDTTEGQIAQKMYESKSGGFSTAIDVRPGTSPAVATGFYGVDWVFSPNFDGNRGYRSILDSAVGGGESEREELLAMLDAVAGESFETARQLNSMFDALQQQHERALQTIEHLAAENDALVGRLAAGPTSPVLDDLVGEGGRVAPKMVDAAPDFERFREMPLAGLAELPSKKRPETSETRILRAFGLKD